MISPKATGVFVTGTDTNVGKTHVSAAILKSLRSEGLRVGAYKPACSGAITDGSGSVKWDDIERLRNSIGRDVPDEAISPQRFLAPVAPPLAARQEGRTVDSTLLISGLEWWIDNAELILVEGAGGLLSPLSEKFTVADVAVAIGFPLIIVARWGLGTINHTLMTVEAARHRQLNVIGIVMNQCQPEDNKWLAEENAAEIEARGQVPVLGFVEWNSEVGLQGRGSTATIPWGKLLKREK